MLDPLDPAEGVQNTRSQLLYLKRWPDFSKEFELSQIRDVARICALLSRKPTVGFLVHRAVDLPSVATWQMLDRLLLTQSIGVFQVGITLSLMDEPALAPLASFENNEQASTMPAPLPHTVDGIHAALPAVRLSESGQTAPSLLKKVWGRFLPS